MTTAGDSAGVPWQGRELPTGGFEGDSGEADPRLMRALTTGSESDVMRALTAARLLVPVTAVASELAEGVGGTEGAVADKEADMAVALLEHPDGRTALPVFTSMEALAAFSSSMRPVPVDAPKAAQAAVSERADLIVLDCASEQAFEVRASMVWALAQQRQWLPAHEDPFVETSIARVCGRHDEVTAHVLSAGAPDGQGVLQIELTLVPGLTQEGIQQLVTVIAEELATDGELRARVDGLSFAIT